MLHALQRPLQTEPMQGSVASTGAYAGPSAPEASFQQAQQRVVTKCNAQQQGWQHKEDKVVVDEGRPVVHRAPLVQDEGHAGQRPGSDDDLGQRRGALHSYVQARASASN